MSDTSSVGQNIVRYLGELIATLQSVTIQAGGALAPYADDAAAAAGGIPLYGFYYNTTVGAVDQRRT
jgi:hypothetical protein